MGVCLLFTLVGLVYMVYRLILWLCVVWLIMLLRCVFVAALAGFPLGLSLILGVVVCLAVLGL